jgi:hypothetical protein
MLILRADADFGDARATRKTLTARATRHLPTQRCCHDARRVMRVTLRR